ncbi:MAG: outer membrane protein assembly factor BamD [Flavobacteriaceae bacterium]|nr:outer membrane protein assembly factor BamD [Flavobacteriaceae bacterium]MDG1966073.1 outer membrane protein assembly factor BamD [Flavobacteriaceae bacterium]
MSDNLKYSFFALTMILLISSCNEYQKVLNNEDMNVKYKAAEEYYNNAEYRRANRILEQLVPAYRGKPQAERLVYFFADSYFQTKNYYLASYQFESFLKSFPKSQKLEEATFFAAKSHYMMSPTFSLDQEETNTAIEKLQIFMNNYPKSKFTDECNQLISELQNKIEKKEFEIAKQYYNIYDYRAAIKSLDNFVGEFVGSKFREEALYYKFLSSYEIAINSVESKKLQRLSDLKQLHNNIVRYYPETLFEEDLTKKMEVIEKEINTFTN